MKHTWNGETMDTTENRKYSFSIIQERKTPARTRCDATVGINTVMSCTVVESTVHIPIDISLIADKVSKNV